MEVPVSSRLATVSRGTQHPERLITALVRPSDALSLASYGSYTKPTTLQISADISPGDTITDGTGLRGIGLGFFSQLNGNQWSNNSFTGLLLDPSGNLNLVQCTNTSGFYATYLGAAVAYGGTFSPNSFYLLSYDVNTATGQISNIALQGSTANYSAFESPTLFTDPATSYAGLFTSSAGYGSPVPGFDNFQVSTGTVPEPSALALLGSGLIALLGYAWRKRS